MLASQTFQNHGIIRRALSIDPKIIFNYDNYYQILDHSAGYYSTSLCKYKLQNIKDKFGRIFLLINNYYLQNNTRYYDLNINKYIYLYY
jgi:hypothetical protein